MPENQLQSSDMKGRDNSSEMIGGLCEYKEYRGKAEIVSIQKINMADMPSSNKKYIDSYKVFFRVSPEEKIQETFVDLKGKEFIFMLSDSSYPDLQFIQKNNITQGKQLDCIIKVITKGSCSPVEFSFPVLQ